MDSGTPRSRGRRGTRPIQHRNVAHNGHKLATGSARQFCCQLMTLRFVCNKPHLDQLMRGQGLMHTLHHGLRDALFAHANERLELLSRCFQSSKLRACKRHD